MGLRSDRKPCFQREDSKLLRKITKWQINKKATIA